MDEARYILLLRSDATHARSTDRATLLAHLLRIPGAAQSGEHPDRFEFGDRDEHGVMTLELFVLRAGSRVPAAEVRDDEAPRCDGVEIGIPRPWVLERGPRVFALVFMLAEWAKWEVFDPQIGDTLQKEAVLSGLVAMRQAQREHERSAAGATEAPAAAGEDDVAPRRPEATPPKPARAAWWKGKR